MPPIAYRYFQALVAPRLNVGESVMSSAQLAMPWGQEEAHTTLTYLGLAEAREFERYAVEHQVDRQGELIYQHQRIGRYIEVKRFTAYYLRNPGYFLVMADKRDSRTLFERLGRASPSIKAKAGELNFAELQELGKTTGGWFKNLKIADVRTSALFGSSTVTDSEEWSRYADLGELSSVYVQLAGPDETVRVVQLTRDRCIVLLNPMGERTDLEFIAHLNCVIEEALQA